jgi:hypothetical protein
MGRLVPLVRVIVLLILAGCLSGCSSSSSPITSTTNFATPTKVALTPSPSSSLEVGGTVSFSATATSAANTTLNEPIAYESSNTAVLTITSTGLACAGSWDSLSNPTVCTPGRVGVAQVTAVAQGISSPVTTVYVHQHIDSITVSAQPGQPTPQSASCFSKGQTYNYQATAYSRQGGPAPGLDITSTVGPFIWQLVNSGVVNITAATPTNPVNGLLPGQATATANVPGTSPIFVIVDGVSSAPFNFNTCLVQSITLAPTNLGGNTVTLPRGSSTAITATVTDTVGNVINGSFLSWCSSDPGSVSTSTANCTLGSTTSFPATASSSGGGAAIIAACTPPNCNINVFPTLPIYPPAPVTVFASGTSTTGTVTTTTWVTTTGCEGTDVCVSELAPITTTIAGGVSTSKVGTLVSLPATPNSLVFNREGTAAYLGTNTGEFGTRGVMVLNAGGKSVTEYPSVVGKVLAVSPDGGTAVVSDTAETPNQVYLFTCNPAASTSGSSSGGACGSASNVSLNIAGATAAAFSSDGLKAYIVSGSTLFVYSKLDALKTISLSAPVNDLTFFSNGAFAYLAGGDPAGVTVRRTCDDSAVQTVATPGVPLFLRALPDGVHVLGVDPPGINILSASDINTAGCAAGVSNTASFVNLGQGYFVPTQLIVSTDGSTAYLLTQSSGSVLVFNVAAHTTSAIPLSGNVLPLQASLTPDGGSLYVGASDGMVHLLNTVGGADILQLSFESQPANLQAGLCANVNFPTQSVINITAVTQSGTSTTYSYTLTSGPALQVGRRITVTGMTSPADNGAFTITALGNGSFTVGNAIGVSAGGQSGTGTVAFACNPDLVAVAP